MSPEVWVDFDTLCNDAAEAIHKREALDIISQVKALLGEENGEPNKLDKLYHRLVEEYNDLPMVWDAFAEIFDANPDCLRINFARKFFRAMPHEERFERLAAKAVSHHFLKVVTSDRLMNGTHASAIFVLRALQLLEEKDRLDKVQTIFQKQFGESATGLLHLDPGEQPRGTEKSNGDSKPMPGIPPRRHRPPRNGHFREALANAVKPSQN